MGTRIPKCLNCGSKKLKHIDTGKQEFTYGPYDQLDVKEVEIYICRDCRKYSIW